LQHDRGKQKGKRENYVKYDEIELIERTNIGKKEKKKLTNKLTYNTCIQFLGI
jgi:hypothetical protein